jgi:hypothetical protein
VNTVFQGHDAVVAQAHGTAPDKDISMFDWQADCLVVSFEAAEEKHRRQTKRPYEEMGKLSVA